MDLITKSSMLLLFLWIHLVFSQHNQPLDSDLIIIDIEAPQSIPLDSGVDEVVLDCPFVTNRTNDLVVKWFYNGTTDQIYQWIPEFDKPPFARGALKHNIDTGFEATNDTLTKFRALKLKNLSPKLSGNYTCKVSNDVSEDMKTHQLTIFSPATSFDMVFFEDSADVVCSVTLIAPRPEIQLIAYGDNGTLIDLPDAIIEEDSYEIEGDDFSFFNVTETLSLNASSATANATRFMCVVRIPGTDYMLNKRIEYQSESSAQLQTISATVAVFIITINIFSNLLY